MASTTSLGFDIWAKDRASDKFDKVGRSADGAGGKLQKMGKVAKFAALGLAAGAVVAGKAMFDMAKAAIEDEKSQALLAHQMRKSAGATKEDVKATEDWISAKGKALGVADDELRPALSRLVVATKDVDKAQRLAALAMDISAAKGKPLKTVSEALAKAQEGNIGALGRLGIKTKDASGKTRELSDITKELAKTYEGSASKAADTTAGKFGRLKLMWDEGKEALGAKLIPVAEKAADFLLNKLGPAASQAGGWFKENLLPPLQDIGGFIKDKLLPFAQEFVAAGLERLRQGFDFVREAVEKNKPELQQLGRFISRVAGFIADKLGPVVVWLAGRAFPLLGKAIGTAIDIVGGLVKGFNKAKNAGEDVVAFVKGIPDKLAELGSKFKEAGKGLIDKFVDGMKNAAGIISGIAGNVWSTVKGLLNGAIDKINAALEFKVSLPGPDISINPPNIPHLANGTFGHRGGLALVGERGPELVSMPRGSKVIPNHRLRGGAEDQPVVVQFVLDGKVIQESLLRLKRRHGGTLGIA